MYFRSDGTHLKAAFRRSAVPALVAALVLSLSGATIAGAAHVSPTFTSGNPSCASLGLTEIKKVEPVASGVYTGSDGTSITVTVVNSPGGPTFNWSATNSFSAVIVKGGPDANVYWYNPAASGDTGLHAPTNPSNGKFYGLSHISFCRGNTATIGGHKWQDDGDPNAGGVGAGDGIEGPGEGRLAGVEIQLRSSDGSTLLATQATNSNGEYSFSGLLAGTYRVCEKPTDPPFPSPPWAQYYPKVAGATDSDGDVSVAGCSALTGASAAFNYGWLVTVSAGGSDLNNNFSNAH